MACTITAFFDRDPKLTPRKRCRLAMLNLVFLRYWHAWIAVTNSPSYNFISVQTYYIVHHIYHHGPCGAAAGPDVWLEPPPPPPA
eukprot:6419663-Prymnesium_polylepis.1